MLLRWTAMALRGVAGEFDMTATVRQAGSIDLRRSRTTSLPCAFLDPPAASDLDDDVIFAYFAGVTDASVFSARDEKVAAPPRASDSRLTSVDMCLWRAA